MNEVKKLLGKRIKEIRTSKKMTQEQLAEKTGLEQRNISYIEKGITFPSQYLLKLSEALDVSIAELLDFEHCRFTIDEMKEYISKSLQCISDKEITTLFRFVKAMK